MNQERLSEISCRAGPVLLYPGKYAGALKAKLSGQGPFPAKGKRNRTFHAFSIETASGIKLKTTSYDYSPAEILSKGLKVPQKFLENKKYRTTF